LILEITLLGEMVKIQGALVGEEVIIILILPLCLLANVQKILQQIKVVPEELKEVPLLLERVA
jgi:hypothetical protein